MKNLRFTLIIALYLLSITAYSQSWEWFTTATDAGTQNIPGKIVSDNSGNTFSIGYFFTTLNVSPTLSLTSSGAADVYIIKRNSDGVPIWAKRFGGAGDDHGVGITLDHSGNIIICGKFSQTLSIGSTILNAVGGFDVFIAKLDNSGNPMWARSFGGADSGVWESANDVATDTLNNIYATGYFFANLNFGAGISISAVGAKSDMFILKMDPSGNYLWAKKGGSTGGGNDYDMGVSIKVSANQNSVVMGGHFHGNVFIYGTDTINTADSGFRDSYIISLNTLSGGKNFVLPIKGAGYTQVRDLDLDPSNNIYVTGYCETNYFYEPNTVTVNTGRYDIFIFKYGPSGNFIWSTGIGNSSWGHESTSILINHQNKILVSGYYRNYAQSGTFSVNGSGMFLARLDTNKTTISMAKATTNLGMNIGEHAMAIDAADNVYFHGIAPTGICTFGATDYPVSNEELFNAKYTFIPCSVAPAQPGTITGPTTMCNGSFNNYYSIVPVSGATSYTWTFPAGWTGVSTTNTVTATAGSSSGNITVKANNACGSSIVQTLAVVVTLAPPQPGVITGPSPVCSGSSVTYSVSPVAGATAYGWNFPSGWLGSSATNSITVTAGISGTIYVNARNACGYSPTRSKAVTVNPLPAQPGSISGNTTICQNTTNTYTIAAVSGATSYTWTLPGGWSGTSTTTSIVTTASTNGGNISVVANNACGAGTSRSLAITVANVPASPGSISGNSAVCPGATNTYSITAVPNSTSYTWSLPGGWSGTSISNSITTTATSSGGTITVTANNSCGSSISQNLSLIVNDLTTSSSSNPTCFGDCNGTATSLPTGTGPFTYLWMPGAQTTQTATGLCVGDYTVTTTGAGGCSATATANISELTSFTVTENHTDATCFGLCNGTINLTPIGGSSPYTFSSPTSGICAGTYPVSVTDANGCIASTSVTITEPPSIQSNHLISGISCNGICDATVSLSPTGGDAPYSFLWCNGGTSNSETNLCSGSCLVQITDVNGCEIIDTITIIEPSPIILNATASSNAICEGSCTTLNALVSGGTPGYTYAWSPGLNLSDSIIANPIACPSLASNYSVNITDANGCTVSDIIPITINQLPTVTYTASPSMFCDNVSSVVLSGGTPAGGIYYGTSVNGNSFSPVAAGSGTYLINYVFTDVNGCTDSAASSITVNVCTGIKDNTDFNDITVYPNPMQENIVITGLTEISQIKIYDVIGKEVLRSQSKKNNIKIDVSDLLSGIYIIQIQSNNDFLIKKIIKE